MNQESLAECLYPHKWYNPFPKFKYTERPDTAAAEILDGKIVLLTDNSPAVMILPVSVFDIMEEADDFYFPPVTGTYLRVTRFVIALLTLLLTPTWLLFLQNPQWIPPQFAFIKISGDLYVPVFAQLLILEFAIDGLKLAAINTPGMLTTPLSVIAGLVVGEFAVQSGWFNAETMLYMAFVAIANYTQASYELGYALKFMRILLLILTALVAAGIFMVVGGPGFVSASAAKRQLPIYSVEREEKVCAISFDAAWGNEDTQMLIDILGKYNVKATFFVVGDWVDKYPESVKALHDAGHEVMNHSLHHDHYNALTADQVVADVTAAQLTALFDGQHTATSRLLLLDPFWDQVYASSDLPAKTLAARLRSQLLAGQALSDSHGAYDYFVRQEPRSGFCLVLQQPKPMTEGTAELMYLVAGLSLLLCLGLCVLASMRFSRQLFEPIRALNSAMREVEEGNLNVQLDNRRIDEMGQLSGRFNRMAQRLRQNLKDSLRQQRELNEAQIRMMQAQLNPHFLYNTLDTIKWMGKIHQAPEIATISADLADILRSSISADELVPLRQELRLVERYVEIQNIRFSGAFALTVEVDEPLRDVPVPKLMLQPLVENAILHGFRDRSGGEIRISAYRTEEDLILTVRDNGCGVPEEVLAQYRDGAPRPGGHFGLHNVDAILRIRYGPDRGVRFVPVQGEGACIRITLPVFRKGEEPPC